MTSENFDKIDLSTCGSIRIWGIENGKVHFSSNKLPDIDKLDKSRDFTWSYYIEEGGFICIGYFTVKNGVLEKNVSWNNKNLGEKNVVGLSYAQKFIKTVCPDRATEIFI
jgi:hypothetical protein